MGETEQGLDNIIANSDVGNVPQTGQYDYLSFKTQPIPVWKSLPHEVLQGIANNNNVDIAAEGTNSINFINFPEELVSISRPKQHKSGRTGAVVQDSNGQFVQVAPGEYRRVKVDHTWKANPDPVLNEIELLFYRELSKKGIVVLPANAGQEKIIFPHMDVTLDKFLSQTAEYSFDPAKAQENITNLSYGMMDVAANATVAADDILWKNPGYRKYIENRSIRAIADQFGVDIKTAKDRFYLFITLKAVAGASEKQAKIYEPLEKLLKESSEVLGAIDLDIKPEHLFVTEKDGQHNLVLHDFNHAEPYSIFSVMARCIDAFIPIRERMGDLPLYWATFSHTSIYTNDEKMYLCGAYMKTWGEITGADAESIIKSDKFPIYIQAWRFRHNAMQAFLALNDLSKADNYRDIYVKLMETSHHLNNAYEAAANLEHSLKTGEFERMAEDLHNTTGKLFSEMIPQKVKQASVEWMRLLV